MAAEIDKLYQDFSRRFGKMSEEQLTGAFNREAGNPGWVSARGAYLRALHNEFIKRGIDYSAIGNEESMSLSRHISISDNKISIVVPPTPQK